MASGREDFAGYLSLLRRTSCPAALRRQSPDAIPLKATAVPLQALNPSRKKLDRLTYVAGFHLSSPSDRFGGLSGLDVLDDGNLLAVSDQGDFIWIDLATDGVTPIAARIAAMRDSNGDFLRDKTEGDAEGLAVNDGLALVSYERDFRVLAFDLAACGAAARGTPITLGGHSAPLSETFAAARIEVGNNSGPEALGVTRDWTLLTGLETKTGQASPLSVRPLEALPDFGVRLGYGLPEFVGMDIIEDDVEKKDLRVFSLHRARNALSPNVISIAETRLKRSLDRASLPRRVVGEIDERSHVRFAAGETRKLADMSLLFTIDNFEGIAAKEMPDGSVRLYLISDNNFSASQRTLLMVFDLE
ncbi:MAG TPA: esterase-like activity of phytase family protein [Hyphomonadaceae bacterium]|nr:esterase-like activity of phytase family protein [Hyphomonadaceae bacterium]